MDSDVRRERERGERGVDSDVRREREGGERGRGGWTVM